MSSATLKKETCHLQFFKWWYCIYSDNLREPLKDLQYLKRLCTVFWNHQNYLIQFSLFCTYFKNWPKLNLIFGAKNSNIFAWGFLDIFSNNVHYSVLMAFFRNWHIPKRITEKTYYLKSESNGAVNYFSFYLPFPFFDKSIVFKRLSRRC